MLSNVITLLTVISLTASPFEAKDIIAITYKMEQEKTFVAWTASWSHDDRFVAIGNDNGELAIYETRQWKKVKSWSYKATTITRVEWNPKYPLLAVAAVWHAGTPSVVQLFDMAENKVLSTLPDTLQGRGVSWSPDGENVAFVGGKGRISLYSKSGEHHKSLSFTNPRSLFSIDWHPSTNLLLAVEEDIYLIDIDRDSLIATYDDGSKNKGILCCEWHKSGDFFVTGDYGYEKEGGEPSYLKYWGKEGTLLKRIKESKFEYRNVMWTRDGKYLAAAADVLLVFNRNGEVISKTKFDDNNLWGVAWNNKGDKIISSDQSGTIRITDIYGKILKTFKQ
jgi:WD40 repeat protein